MANFNMKDYDNCKENELKHMSDMATGDIESMMNILAVVQYYMDNSDEWLNDFIKESLDKWFTYFDKRRWDYWEMVIDNEKSR